MKWFDKMVGRQNEPSTPDSSNPEQANPSGVTGSGPVAGDNPIRRSEDDVLGRASVAQSFAQQVLSLDAREGIVVGVLGAWGSGKTSFMNLAQTEFDRVTVPVLHFNPWMFSGAEQLVDSFFVELAAQLRVHSGLAAVGKSLEDYGEMFSGMGWLPLVGPWIERGRGAAKILGRMLQNRKEGISGRRANLGKALADLKKPIVVVLDDIDRLTSSEIRDVFKLVRLTASFPNIIYVVAFDRVRVEGALAEQGVPGRAYLEKILQVTVDLPAVPTQVLSRQVSSALDAALAAIDRRGPFDEQLWPDVLMEIIRPLIRNMRDVRRYAVAVPGTVVTLKGEVALVDVLALEAVRVFLPEVFGSLHGAIDGLTTTSWLNYGSHHDPAHLKAQVEGLIKAAGTHGDVVRAMIMRLFPAAERHVGGSHYGSDWKGAWLKERRVAHEDLLRLYLERVEGESLKAFTDAEKAWACVHDRYRLDQFLRSLDAERLEDVIASLEVFEGQFAPQHVVPTTIVLLNLLPDLPEREQGMYDLHTGFVVTRVAYRLVRSLKEPAAVEAAVAQILPELKSLSSKMELLTVCGYREGAGHRLISATASAELEQTWRNEVRAAAVDGLARERDPLRVLLQAKREADAAEEPLYIDSSPELTLAVLRAARTEQRSQTMGNRAVHRTPRLAWAALVELYGDEATLRERIQRLKATGAEGADDLIELADKYLSGWRPEPRDD